MRACVSAYIFYENSSCHSPKDFVLDIYIYITHKAGLTNHQRAMRHQIFDYFNFKTKKSYNINCVVLFFKS